VVVVGRRRTTLEIRGQATPEVRQGIDQMLAKAGKVRIAG
jgi:hypothetical protein